MTLAARINKAASAAVLVAYFFAVTFLFDWDFKIILYFQGISLYIFPLRKEALDAQVQQK